MKHFTFFFLIVFSVLLMTAETFGVTKTASRTGNWSDTRTWGNNPVPTSSDNVYINAGITVTVTANASCNSLTFKSGATSNSTVSINSGITLTVSGAITINSDQFNSFSATITGAGTINCGSVAIGTNINPYANCTTTLTSTISNLNVTNNLTLTSNYYYSNSNNTSFIQTSGTVTVNGSIATSNENASNTSTYTMENTSPTLILGGATPFNISSTGTSNITLNGNGATVIYNDDGTQTARPTTYTNLTLSGSGAKTTTGITVNGILSMEGTATASTAPTYGTAATLQYNTSTARTAGVEWITTFAAKGGVIIANTGTITLNEAKVLNSGVPLTINSGATLTVSNYNLTLGGNFTNNGTFTAGTGTVILNGTSTQTFGGTSSTTFYNLTINTGATLSVGSSNYALTLGGDFTNNGTFTAGTGTVTLNGTSTQKVGGTSTTTFYNLTMNNNSAYGVTLGNSEIVSNTLTLTGGKIFTDTNKLTLGTGTSALGALSPASPPWQTSYIVGNFERWFSASAMTDMAWFPVGTATSFRPAGIKFTAAPNPGGKILVAGYNSNPGSMNTAFLTDVGSYVIDRYSKDAWWQITPTTLNGGTYSVSLGAFSITGVNDFTKLRVLKRATSSSLWALAGTNSPGNGTNLQPFANRDGLTGFSQFGIGGYSTDNPLNTDAPLPVSLASLTSSTAGRNVMLKWTTISEINNSGFDIERKGFSGEFRKVGFVQGKGTVSTPSSYEFTDRNLVSGKYSYRLKQIDNNGNFEYFTLSGDVIVGVPSKFDLSQNYPNPFNPSTKINFDMPKDGLVSLKIYDLLGREVTTLVNEARTAGYYTVEFNATSLTSGIYFYRINAGEFSSVKKMLILK